MRITPKKEKIIPAVKRLVDQGIKIGVEEVLKAAEKIDGYRPSAKVEEEIFDILSPDFTEKMFQTLRELPMFYEVDSKETNGTS